MAREVRQQVFHLVGEHAPALEEYVLGIGRRERDRDQLHAGLLGRARRLQVVAAAAGRDHVRPDILAALAEWPDVVARELARWEALRAVHAEERVAAKQRLVVERRHVVVARIARVAGVADRRDDRVHVEDGALASAGIGAAAQAEDRAAAGVGDLFLVIEPGGFLVVDPLERHARYVRAQDELGERAASRARDDAQIVEGSPIRAVEIDAFHCIVRLGRFMSQFNVARR